MRSPGDPLRGSWLNAFLLTSSFVVRLSPDKRAYMFNFIRRTEGAFFAYREARNALIDYIHSPRNVVSPYFRSLLNFEVCISQCWQGLELFMKDSGQRLYEPDDGSGMERLHGLYIDSKHMDRMIDKGELPDAATASVWITNQGLEGTGAASMLSFTGLVAILTSMGRCAEQLSQLKPSDSNPPFRA